MLGFEFCDEGLEIGELLEQCFVGAKVIILGVDDGGGLMALVGCEVDGSVEGAAGNADGAGLFCHLFCSPVDRANLFCHCSKGRSIAFKRGAIGFLEFCLLLDFVVVEFAVGLDGLDNAMSILTRIGGY